MVERLPILILKIDPGIFGLLVPHGGAIQSKIALDSNQ